METISLHSGLRRDLEDHVATILHVGVCNPDGNSEHHATNTDASVDQLRPLGQAKYSSLQSVINNKDGFKFADDHRSGLYN